jgi:hypothetical protein
VELSIVRTEIHNALAGQEGRRERAVAELDRPFEHPILHGIEILVDAGNVNRAVTADRGRRPDGAERFVGPLEGAVLGNGVKPPVERTDVHRAVDADGRRGPDLAVSGERPFEGWGRGSRDAVATRSRRVMAKHRPMRDVRSHEAGPYQANVRAGGHPPRGRLGLVVRGLGRRTSRGPGGSRACDNRESREAKGRKKSHHGYEMHDWPGQFMWL